MTLTFDHTHGLDNGISRSNFEIAVSQEWEVGLTLDKRGCKSVSHGHDSDLLVTKVRLKDLADSDRVDFRCRCAIDSSSLLRLLLAKEEY